MGSRLGLDFGGSTVDYVLVDGSGEVLGMGSFERADFGSLDEFVAGFEGLSEICVTGGRSREIGNSVCGVPVKVVSEIDAIGRGGRYLIFDQESKIKSKVEGEEDLIVTSMGTGVCIVRSGVNGECEHVGGTGVGGGTMLSLSSLLLGVNDLESLFKLYEKGDHNKVDVLVSDIVGSGIGKVPDFWTASNLGKALGASDADLAAGIVYLVGQTIGLLTSFAANRFGVSRVCLIGKLARFGSLKTVFESIGEVYGVEFLIPENADLGTCFGGLVKKGIDTL